METPRQSNDKKCRGVRTETSSQSTNLCQLENNTQSDPDKCVWYCKTCHLPLSRTNREQHKLHEVETLKKAADDARKRLEDFNERVQLITEQFRKSCLTNIKQYENKGLTTEDLHRVVDSEFDRISKALKDSPESVKEERELQYKNYLQDLKKTKSSLEKNIETLKTKQREIEYLSDIDLLCTEDTLTKELQSFQNNINVPTFDQEGELVENSLIQTVYSQKEKGKIQQKEKEHEQLRMEREYFENAFETVMALVKSLVSYRVKKEEMKENIRFHLPKVPQEIGRFLQRKMKMKRSTANDELTRLKNIVIDGPLESQFLNSFYPLFKTFKLSPTLSHPSLYPYTEKEHEQLRMEREYFENAFETVMALVKSLVSYRVKKEEMKENIRFHLPKVPQEIGRFLQRKMKMKRSTANDELTRLKNIVIEMIDIERQKEQDEIKSSEKRNNKDTTHESTTTGSESQIEETKETIQRVKDQNERMRNVIKTIDKWINICHIIVKESEVDKIDLTLPSEDVMSEKGKQTLETNRKKLEDICQMKIVKECRQLRRIELEKTFYETSLKETFKTLTAILQLRHRIVIKLPKVPELEDETAYQEMKGEGNDAKKVLKDLTQMIFKEGEKMKQMELEKNYFENTFKEILATLISTLQSREDIQIKLPEVPELEDGTKFQEMKEGRKGATEVLNALLTKKNKKELERLKNKLQEADRAVIERDSYLKRLLGENNALMHVTANQKMDIEEKDRLVLELEYKLKIVTAEKENASLRISKLPGAKLTEDNPGISDLSDGYRPWKLAGMFNELYDNEWADALSALMSEMKKSEEYGVHSLLEILHEINVLCQSGVVQQQSNVYNALILKNDGKTPEMTTKKPSKQELRTVKDFQKKMAASLLPQLEQSILENETFRGPFRKEARLCQPYIRKCIQLCWMMNVRDPAMELVFEFYPGQNIDEKLIKPYRKRGSKINYLVWPVLLLHHDGPVAQKGIAQPI